MHVESVGCVWWNLAGLGAYGAFHTGAGRLAALRVVRAGRALCGGGCAGQVSGNREHHDDGDAMSALLRQTRPAKSTCTYACTRYRQRR